LTDRYARLAARVAAVDRAGLRRVLRPLSMVSPTEGLLDGQPVDVFCSNDYLGLALHPAVVAAWRGAGSGSARLISGDRPVHHALEDRLEGLYGRPVTLFSSGWHANQGLMTTLLEAGDLVVSDALNHASIIDGIRLSKADRAILPHGSLAVPAGARLVVTEGLFSMDGDVPDLVSLYRNMGGAWLCVDEAHAVGAIGPGGRGESFAQGLVPDFVVGTFGKALGSMGAFVVGPPELKALLTSQARAFLFTTGLAEPAARAALVALELADDARRERLSANVRRLRAGLWSIGLPAPGAAHIVPIELGPATMIVAERLLAAGFYVSGIRPPTVAPGTERLRVTLSAEHRPEQIDRLIDALERALRGGPRP
jgi:8-amino-7-oxononanoate synthase